MDLRFRDVVIVGSHLEREWTAGNCKAWITRKYPKKRTGILIGFRTLSDGRVIYDSECTEYHGVSYFKAVLVALGPRIKPILVKLDDVTNEIDMSKK